MSRNHSPNNRKGSGDKFVWIAYSDLSTMLMLCFILIFMALSFTHGETRKKNKELREKVDVSNAQRQAIIDELRHLVKEVKNNPSCKNTIWNVDPPRNAIQVSFERVGGKLKEWFPTGSALLTPEGKKCVTLFSKKWLETLFQKKYRSKISQLIVEGHADSTKNNCKDKEISKGKNKDFLCNLKLSQNRSLSTVNVIFQRVTKKLYRGTEVGKQWKSFFKWRKKRLTATGRSSSLPIPLKDEAGNKIGAEDKDKSRRVEFRFEIDKSDVYGERGVASK